MPPSVGGRWLSFVSLAVIFFDFSLVKCQPQKYNQLLDKLIRKPQQNTAKNTLQPKSEQSVDEKRVKKQKQARRSSHLSGVPSGLLYSYV